MSEESVSRLVPPLDPEVGKECKKIIVEAITTGTPLFNEGKIEECVHLWVEAVHSLADLVKGREEENMLRCALATAENQQVTSRSWTLRMGMETFNSLHFSTKNMPDIHGATTNGYIEKVRILSQITTLVNYFKHPHIPIHLAVQRGHRDIVKVLLEHSADVNCPTADLGQTPLQLAAMRGDLEITEILIQHKAALEVTCDTWTALHFAVEGNFLPVARLLIESGAESSPVGTYRFGSDEKFVTPLDIALHAGDRHLLAGLLQYPQIKPERFLTLSKLKISQVNIDSFPMGLAQLRCLTRLDISCNNLQVIPEGVSAMTNLRDLDFTSTELTEFPRPVCSLRSVSRLILASNKIREVPADVSGLVQLERLDLSNNFLVALPEELGHLSRLRKLCIEGNPLHSIPKETIAKGTSRLLEYLRQISGYSADWRKIKLMFVGEVAVGKTSLLRSLKGIRQVKKSNSLPTSIRRSKGAKREEAEPVSTDGVDVSELTMNENLLFSAWDFAGQQVFYQTHQFFLTSRCIYLIIFNLVDLDESRIRYWLRQIRATSSDRPPVFLVGTHLDDPHCTSSYLESVHSTLDACFPAKIWNIVGIHYVSLRTEKGVKTFFKALRKTALNHKTITQKVPETFIMLDRLLTEEKNTRQLITWDEYCKFAMDCSIPMEKITVVTNFLHDVGTLMHYNCKESGLDQYVILDPQWLADVMASLVSFKHQWVKTGILTLDILPQVWKQYDPTIHESLLGLLTRFEVAVKLGSGDSTFYVIPTLLPSDPPPDCKESLDWRQTPDENEYQFGRVYRFNFEFDFSKLIARIFALRHINVLQYWKNGMHLQARPSENDTPDRDGAEVDPQQVPEVPETAHIEWKPKACRLTIQVRAERTAYADRQLIFLRLLVEMIESILESFYPGNQDAVQRLVPCCHCIELGDVLLGPFHFTYEECVSAVTNGKSFVYCRGVPTRPVNICYLAPDIAFKDFPIIGEEDLQVLEQVGSGGFGLVFRGLYAGNVDVAIKELRSEDNSEPQDELEKFKEFQREVGIMSGLNHANLVKLYGITIQPHLRMVMEWCPESDLYHFLLSDAVIDWKLRIRICLDIAKGMRYLQGVTPPIIHRDLRSPNIFMMSQNPSSFVVAKVADFGLSMRVEHRVGGFLPTWRWLAPEVIDVSNVYYDQTADIYSFAIVMWEVVTRDAPFFEYEKDIREMQIKHKIIHENLRPTIPNECPKELAELIRDCWKTNPKERPTFETSARILSKIMHKMFPQDRSAAVDSKDSTSPSIRHLPMQLSSQHPLNIDPAEKLQRSWNSLSAIQSLQTIHLPLDKASGVYAILQVSTKIWTGHSDGHIIVWDAMTRTMLDRFCAHEDRVQALILVEGRVWSSSTSIKVWDARDYSNLGSLKEPHKNLIRNLQWVSVNPDESYVWSGDVDGLVCVWDITTSRLIHQLQLDEPINCISHFGNYVWVGLYRSLRLYDCRTNELTRTFDVNIAYDMAPCRGKMWVACNDKIRVWDCKTLRMERELEGHTSKVVCIIEAGNRVWSASFDKTILLWKPENYRCIQELKGVHQDTITCLVEAGFGVVWSGDRRGVLSVWGEASVSAPEQSIAQSTPPEVQKSKSMQVAPRHRRMRSRSCK